MERTPKKSKALIITLVIVIVLSIMAYLMFVSKSGIFSVKDSTSNKGFSSLFSSLRPSGLTTTKDGVNGEKQVNVDTTPSAVDTSTGSSTGGQSSGSNSGSGSNFGNTNGGSTNTDFSDFTNFTDYSIFPNFNPLPTPFPIRVPITCTDASGNRVPCTTPPAGTFPQCSDGKDNDRDTLIDKDDSGCHTDFDASNDFSYNKSLNNESSAKPPLPQCGDGLDNDRDTLIDAEDGGCHTDFDAGNALSYNKNLDNESNTVPAAPQCSDKKDNDKDNLVDEKDPGCHTDFDAGNNASYRGLLDNESLTKETLPECGDGKDNDNDNLIDIKDPSCHTDFDKTNSLSYNSKLDDESLTRAILTECSDNGDNDGDGFVDEEDPSCHTDYNANNTLTYEKNLNNESKVGGGGVLEVGGMCPDDPLVFTEEEKTQLAALLKQYYLLSPTLRIEDDITVLEADNQTNEQLLAQATTLIKDCKEQKANPAYTGPKEVKNSPYYQNTVESTEYLTGYKIYEWMFNIW